MAQTILVVDDDVVLGQVLSRVLGREGHATLIANDQSRALELAEQHRPRIGLIDLCLPDGDGVSLAEQLRREHPDMVLLLMTAYPLRVQDNPEISRLFGGLLIKPLNLAQLRETIERTAAAISCA